MNDPELIPATFTLSSAARRAVEDLREEYDTRFPDDPAAVLSVAWGYVEGSDPFSGRPILSFYPQSQAASVGHGVQEVSGVKLVYFTTDRFHPLFDGKALDHTADRGFFLREP